MGKNNRARRAARSKARSRRGTPRSRGEQPRSAYDDVFPPSPEQVVASLWFELELAVRHERPYAEQVAGRLATTSVVLADGFARTLLLDLVPQLWAQGWQPVEVRREVLRRTTAASARLIEIAILADHHRPAAQGVDPRWASQLAELTQRHLSTRGDWVADWRRREAIEPDTAYVAIARMVRTLTSLPRLDLLIPPPGAQAGSAPLGIPDAQGVKADPALRRIRGLLAKAESTEFEEEAESLTAKAQELMTRYAIDQALVGNVDQGDRPRLTRVMVDAPYADAKSLLLAAVAEANRCRAVFLSGLDMSTVAGHADDLEVVELLFTSLLVQAHQALRRAAHASEFGRRGRSASFRSSFFIAFAHRIGDRLRGVSDDVVESAGGDALPVLRAREAAVDELFDAHFGGSLRESGVRGGYDYAGQALGRQAADEAKLDSGELLW